VATDPIELNVEYKDFHAVRNHMAKNLHVTGTCIVRGGGVAVRLRDFEGNSGINPKMLVLELDFTLTAEDPSEQPVEWHGEWDDERYEEVEFRVAPDRVTAPPPHPEKIEDVR
jgi:hypothetical protein